MYLQNKLHYAMKKTSTLLLSALMISGLTFAQDKTKSAQFDAAGDRIVIPPSALNLGRSEFTIEAYVIASTNLVTNNVQAPIIISKKGVNAASIDGMVFGLNDKGKAALQLGNESFPRAFAGSNPGVPSSDIRNGSCYHIAFTRETDGASDTISAYENAALIRRSRQNSQSDWDINSNDTVYIGYSSYTGSPQFYQWEGFIKEIRIWNYARTEQQIWADKDKHLVGNETGLLYYWRLHENTGNIAYDCGPNGADGTLNGASWATFVACDKFPAIPSPNNCFPSNPPPTGIKDVNGASAITLYPNPVVNEIRFEGDQKIDLVNVFDLSGRNVLQQNWNGTEALDLTSLEAGMYVIQLSNDNQVVFKSTISKE